MVDIYAEVEVEVEGGRINDRLAWLGCARRTMVT